MPFSPASHRQACCRQRGLRPEPTAGRAADRTALGRHHRGPEHVPFWTDGKDKHRKIVSDQFRAGTGVFPFVANYKFTQLNNENVWAKAMSRVVNERWTADKAVEEMVARIKEIAGTM